MKGGRGEGGGEFISRLTSQAAVEMIALHRTERVLARNPR